jgi:hypothetical protein
MTNPRELGEVRISTPSTTPSTSYADPDTFAASATKIRAMAKPDVSELKRLAEPDTTLQSEAHIIPAPIPTIIEGSAKIEFPLPTAESDTATDDVIALLGACLGGVQAPTSRTYAALGTHSASTIEASGIDDEKVGAAVLVGVRGDGRGNGEVRRITANGTADQISVDPPMKAAPIDTDAIVVSTTVYVDADAAQKYVDALIIDSASLSQHQLLAAVFTSLEVQGMAVGEIPRVLATLTPQAWRAPTADLASLSTDSPEGNLPAGQPGGMFFSDRTSATRTAYAGGLGSVSNMAANRPLEGPNNALGVSKVQDFTRDPMVEFDVDVTIAGNVLASLKADFAAKTAKQLIHQWGHTAQSCTALDIQLAYQREEPSDAEWGGHTAAAVMLRASAVAGSGTALSKSPVRWHFF